MKLQQQQPSELPISALLKDTSKQEAVVRSLLQALSCFGYTQTIKSLQKQSKIVHQKSKIQRVQSLLKQKSYKAVKDQIECLSLNAQARLKIKIMLDQLQVNYLVSKGEIDQALIFLVGSSLSEESQLKYCQMIALDALTVQSSYFQSKNNEILQICQIQTTNDNSVYKKLTQYLLSNAVDECKRKVQPPKVVVAESEQDISMRGVVTFTKFNQTGNQLALVSESDHEYEISRWVIKGNIVTKMQSISGKAIGQITSVKWSQDYQNPTIGVCSYQNFILFKTNQLSISFIVNRLELSLPRFLCFAWNPINQIIYLSGLFSRLLSVDSQGTVATEADPFVLSREILFSPKGDLFAIGATKQGQLIKYSLNEQKIQKQFTVTSIFMDMKYHQQKIIVSNKQYIYVINANTLIPIYTIDSPSNQSMYKIEVFFCGPWLITFNQKLKATLKCEKLIRQVKLESCDAADVRGKMIVTCNKSIKVWSYFENDQEEEQQIQVYQQRQRQSSPCQSSQSSQESVNISSQGFNQMMQVEYINVEQEIDHSSQ